jgi:hypothetical protein
LWDWSMARIEKEDVCDFLWYSMMVKKIERVTCDFVWDLAMVNLQCAKRYQCL